MFLYDKTGVGPRFNDKSIDHTFDVTISDEVCAVRSFRATCSKMSKENFTAFTSFLNKDVCLTHLKLWIEHSSAISLVQILHSLMDNTVLQCLDLTGHPITHKDGVKKGDLISRFLRQVKTLKKMIMESCGLVEDTGNMYA